MKLQPQPQPQLQQHSATAALYQQQQRRQRQRRHDAKPTTASATKANSNDSNSHTTTGTPVVAAGAACRAPPPIVGAGVLRPRSKTCRNQSLGLRALCSFTCLLLVYGSRVPKGGVAHLSRMVSGGAGCLYITYIQQAWAQPDLSHLPDPPKVVSHPDQSRVGAPCWPPEAAAPRICGSCTGLRSSDGSRRVYVL